MQEAGGKVTDYSGGPLDLFGDELLASNGILHEEMISVIEDADDPGWLPQRLVR